MTFVGNAAGMTDHEPFLKTILERPGDDAPRMVYADWLEEQGDPRGEFIRLQLRLKGVGRCRYEQGGKVPDEPRRAACFPPWCVECRKVGGRERANELRDRESELLDEYRMEWVPYAVSCTKLTRFIKENLTFGRGFVEGLTCEWLEFKAYSPILFEHLPIRWVRFEDKRPMVVPGWGDHCRGWVYEPGVRYNICERHNISRPWYYAMHQARRCRASGYQRLGVDPDEFGVVAHALVFNNDHEARAALSNIAVMFGRQWAKVELAQSLVDVS